MRPILAEAVGLARRALLELQPTGVGEHLGVTAEDEYAATHHFAATLPGYRGWQWAVVVAAPLEAEYATVSESALLPGPDALVAPDFVPWDQRVRPGDLAPGDLLAPPVDDPRLVPGYLVTGDPVVDEVIEEIGLGRPQVLSREGREEAALRWYTDYGPDTDMARSAPSTCGVCGFFVPLAGAFRSAFGVCANAMGADGHVVHTEYGCGAHSDTVVPTGTGSPLYEAYDDAAVDLIPTTDLRRPADAVVAEDASADGPEPKSEEIVAESASVTTETESSAGNSQVAVGDADSAVAETISSASPEVVDTDVEVVPADESVAASKVAVGDVDSAVEGTVSAEVAEDDAPEVRTSAQDSASAGVEADSAVAVVPTADERSASADESVGAPGSAVEGAAARDSEATVGSSDSVVVSATDEQSVSASGSVVETEAAGGGHSEQSPEAASVSESVVEAEVVDSEVDSAVVAEGTAGEGDSAVGVEGTAGEVDSAVEAEGTAGGSESVVEAEGAVGEVDSEVAGPVPSGAEDSGERAHYSDAWAVSAVRVKPGEVGGAEER
ncbi:DUF3027 family protein [Nocardia pseudobrasiliensis]|uniref:DUF3027 family protein n=1 Tax=Nocardia pseudobrasiliensis TaxID=45979 RepID=A0A370HSB9_9NOCA|nr:DUF3027 family protein [Nocardia pseudobrasiliensis]